MTIQKKDLKSMKEDLNVRKEIKMNLSRFKILNWNENKNSAEREKNNVKRQKDPLTFLIY